MKMVYIVQWQFKKGGFEEKSRFEKHSSAVEYIDTLLANGLPDNARLGMYAEVTLHDIFGEETTRLIEVDHMRTVKQLKEFLQYD